MAAFTGNSIVGQVVAGDGHVVSSGQHGVVVGVSSPAAFGAVTALALAPPQTRAVSGLGSAQTFGALTFRTPITKLVGGVASAGAFGSAAAKPAPTTVPVGGIGTAQSFGTIKIVWSQIVQVPGLPQQTGLRSIVGGVVSGDGHLVGGTGLLFGFVKIIPGRITVSLDALGLGSAQQFGVPHIAFWQPLPILGVPSAQQFGQPVVYLVWVYDLPCTDLDLAAITCTDLTFSTVTCDTLTLVTAAATTLDLTASEADDLDLQPAGCD